MSTWCLTSAYGARQALGSATIANLMEVPDMLRIEVVCTKEALILTRGSKVSLVCGSFREQLEGLAAMLGKCDPREVRLRLPKSTVTGGKLDPTSWLLLVPKAVPEMESLRQRVLPYLGFNPL